MTCAIIILSTFAYFFMAGIAGGIAFRYSDNGDWDVFCALFWPLIGPVYLGDRVAKWIMKGRGT